MLRDPFSIRKTKNDVGNQCFIIAESWNVGRYIYVVSSVTGIIRRSFIMQRMTESHDEVIQDRWPLLSLSSEQ